MFPVTSIVAFIAILGVSNANSYSHIDASGSTYGQWGNGYLCTDGKIPSEVSGSPPIRHTYNDVTCSDDANMWLGDIFYECDIPQTTAEHTYQEVYAYDNCCQRRGDRYINNGVVIAPDCAPITPR
jgi:hypothetical protein